MSNKSTIIGIVKESMKIHMKQKLEEMKDMLHEGWDKPEELATLDLEDQQDILENVDIGASELIHELLATVDGW